MLGEKEKFRGKQERKKKKKILKIMMMVITTTTINKNSNKNTFITCTHHNDNDFYFSNSLFWGMKEIQLNSTNIMFNNDIWQKNTENLSKQGNVHGNYYK